MTTKTRQYLVTIHGSANMTAEPWQIHTILTSRDNIQPAERVEVVAVDGTRERITALIAEAEAEYAAIDGKGKSAYYQDRLVLSGRTEGLRMALDALGGAK